METAVNTAPPTPAPPARRPVLAALPRRKASNKGAPTASVLALPPRRQLKAPAWRAAGRLLLWVWRFAGYYLGNFLAKLKGANGPAERAVRLRVMLETMGPTAVKMGQQLSVRADLLSHEYCDELSKMLDSVPPFPVAEAIKIVERSIGRPLEDVFETFDPEPIGSASLACVYQAKLHAGDLVAVKVKRPGIGEQLATDLTAICWLCSLAELFGVLRSGLTQNFQLELTRMLTEELDFTLEGRYTDIFRRDAKKHKYVSAPRVYHEFSSINVLVTEFVAGALLGEILYAIERKDRSALNDFMARGFDPQLIAKRMLHIFWWELFESRFFHADPHPSNIIVKPDNTLVMIDFGSCGAVSSRIRRKLTSFNRFMVTDDLNGMVQTTISMLEPLPRFDVDSFYQELLGIYREGFIAHKSKNAPWFDKCSGGMWMKVIVVSQKYNLPMTLDTVRIFRANFLYDSIVFRLDVGVDPQAEYIKYAERLDRKNRRRMVRGMLARACGPLDSDFTRQAEVNQMFENAFERMKQFLDEPRYNFAFTIGKVAYAMTVMIKSLLFMAGFTLGVSGARVAYVHFTTESTPASLWGAITWMFSNKLILAVLFGSALLTVRKLLMKLEDVEIEAK